jgi:hypothetical protein
MCSNECAGLSDGSQPRVIPKIREISGRNHRSLVQIIAEYVVPRTAELVGLSQIFQ